MTLLAYQRSNHTCNSSCSFVTPGKSLSDSGLTSMICGTCTHNDDTICVKWDISGRGERWGGGGGGGGDISGRGERWGGGGGHKWEGRKMGGGNGEKDGGGGNGEKDGGGGGGT